PPFFALSLLARAGLLRPAYRVFESVVARRFDTPSVAHDGLPLPPAELIVKVAGAATADWFLESGRLAFGSITAHVPVEELTSVLDFGCGCGRVARHWHDFAGNLAGCDANEEAIAWCATNLPFGS